MNAGRLVLTHADPGAAFPREPYRENPFSHFGVNKRFCRKRGIPGKERIFGPDGRHPAVDLAI
jgi:hypothetical protein